MMRHCDGNDPNLLFKVTTEVAETPTGTVEKHVWEPCKCGAWFDDVYTIVIYPHERF